MENIDNALTREDRSRGVESHEDHVQQSEYHAELAEKDVKHAVLASAGAGGIATLTFFTGHEIITGGETVDIGHILAAAGGIAMVGITISKAKSSMKDFSYNFKRSLSYKKAAPSTDMPKEQQ